MKIVGIVAEYNPFHRGHAFHLKEARRLADADIVIAAMSGNYVQRGVPAMFDKYTRAASALSSGADLVLELPPSVSTGSAEYFASGAVRLLMDTGIVTDLCFGSECGDLGKLLPLAGFLAEEPEGYRLALQERLREGQTFPQARSAALSGCGFPEAEALLAEPNNVLGVEYLKALGRFQSNITPHTVPRLGAGYREDSCPPSEGQPASAQGIRRALTASGGRFSPQILRELPEAAPYLPYDGKPPVTEDAFSLLLLEKLRRLEGQPLTGYFGVTEELSNRIKSCLDDFRSFSQFTELLKTKNLTRTAVSRALLHILLDVRDFCPAPCVRVLGLRRKAEPILGLLSERSSLPVVTGLPGAQLPEEWLYADRLYESVRSLLHDTPYRNEYRRKLLTI